MCFDASVDGFNITLDASPEVGGHNFGPRPKPLLLVAMAGCTGMDITSLAKKMRLDFSSIEIEAQADKSEQIPIVFTAMRLIYRFESQSTPAEKVLKIVNLSQERYCGVAAMLSQVAPVTYQIYLNGQLIQ